MCLALMQSTQLGHTNARVPRAYDDLKTALCLRLSHVNLTLELKRRGLMGLIPLLTVCNDYVSALYQSIKCLLIYALSRTERRYLYRSEKSPLSSVCRLGDLEVIVRIVFRNY